MHILAKAFENMAMFIILHSLLVSLKGLSTNEPHRSYMAARAGSLWDAIGRGVRKEGLCSSLKK